MEPKRAHTAAQEGPEHRTRPMAQTESLYCYWCAGRRRILTGACRFSQSVAAVSCQTHFSSRCESGRNVASSPPALANMWHSQPWPMPYMLHSSSLKPGIIYTDYDRDMSLFLLGEAKQSITHRTWESTLCDFPPFYPVMTFRFCFFEYVVSTQLFSKEKRSLNQSEGSTQAWPRRRRKPARECDDNNRVCLLSRSVEMSGLAFDGEKQNDAGRERARREMKKGKMSDLMCGYSGRRRRQRANRNTNVLHNTQNARTNANTTMQPKRIHAHIFLCIG